MCEIQHSPLARTLNVVSSDTIIDGVNSPVFKTRAAKHHQLNSDVAEVLYRSKNDGYKKMNKVPMQDEIIRNLAQSAEYTTQNDRVRGANQSNTNWKKDNKEKHSAHVTHRARIPPIAQQIKMQADLSRLNLKTREEAMTKENKLMNTIRKAARDSFDVSVDLSPIGENQTTSGFSTIEAAVRQDYLPKMTLKSQRDGKIDTKFLKQSEILHMKPDGFRRISIHTDVEFRGGTNAFNQSIGQGLHPLSHSRVTNTIMEDVERGVEDDEENDERLLDGNADSNSNNSILPKKRMKHKQMQIRDSVLQSRNESSRINDILSNK